MAAEATILERQNGIYYTPSPLAEYLAKPLVYPGVSILDPAYGEGSLLLAAEKVYQAKRGSRALSLHGCDTKPVNGLLKHLPEANLKRINFFDYSVEHKFPVILMNPPYVRHHKLDAEQLAKIRSRFPDLAILSQSSDLWAYFLMKSIHHLKPGGNIGAILPWSFLQADYSQAIRQRIAGSFQKIRILSLSGKHFEKAQERVVLVWLSGFGQNCESFQIGHSQDVVDKITFLPVPVENWLSEKVLSFDDGDLRSLMKRCQNQFGFDMFSKYADVKIGVVTGADKFFILPEKKAKELGMRARNLKPIITTTKEFLSVLISGGRNLKRLFLIKQSDYNRYRSYLMKGHFKNVSKTAHSLRRKPWYSVNVGDTPDAFFPYRISLTPYLLENAEGLQCTNSIHRIYFKPEVSETQKMWIYVSILSIVSQLSIEMNSKTYGRGMLKIEPSSLKNSLVLVKEDESVIEIYNSIQSALRSNKKRKAIAIATRFISQQASIPANFVHKLRDLLEQIHEIRIPKQSNK